MNKPSAKSGPRRRPLLLVLTAAGIALVSALFWKPIQTWITAQAALRSSTLDENSFRELVQQSPAGIELIQSAWNTGKISHRRVALACLGDLSTDAVAASPLAPVLLRGAADADASVRELALSQLDRIHHPDLASAATRQLSDKDPEIRLLGLRYLRNEPIQLIQRVIPLLDDPDPRVCASAAAQLRKWTGEDFGVRASQVMPVKDEANRETANPTDLAAFQKGIASWKNWWAERRTGFASTNALQTNLLLADTLYAADFALSDLKGATVHLSDFQGKPVLLNFWATWCTACAGELATLNELQRRHPEFVVLGISLDGVPDEHGHANGPESTEHGAEPESKIREKVARRAEREGLAYRILLDPKNAVGARFNGGELPTNVIIDGQGKVARRFIGPRTVETFEAMLADAKAKGS